MRHLFDHLGREIGLAALGPCGLTVPEDVIAPDARRADLRHEPDPARVAERARLGLLGRVASVLCLIELYSGAPDEDDALACLGKLIAFRQRRRREARKKRNELKKPGRKSPSELFVRPLGWIITAGCPASVLAGIAATRAAGWPPGVYFSPGVLFGPRDGAALPGLDGAGGMFRMGIIVASELPRDRSTLLVRFLAAGPLLADAIVDLGALEEGAHEHAVAEQILVELRDVLGKKPSLTPEEKEFIVTMESPWAKARSEGRKEGRDEGRKEGRDEGRKEGRDEGRAEEAGRAVLAVLRVRGFVVSDAARERVLAERDPARLERWHERAILAASIADVLDEPS
jgi:hypothetical protein